MPPRNKSDVSFVKTTLRCPIYAADFDPYNRGYLVVGGGGGESKTGVANQISVLDVSSRAAITTAVDIELSREEDNVQSLASLATKDGLIVFAGINSSMKDQNAGKNEHLRSFSVKCPRRKKQKTEDSSQDENGEWKLLDKRSLFRTSTAAKKETYQRILRLSPSRKRESGSNRIGAIASGMAKDSEIIVFDATKSVPDTADILTRIDLPEDEEAADLDISEPDEAEFSLVYCTDYDINEQTYKYDFKSKNTEKTPKGPRRVHQMPFPDAMENPSSRPKFRSLRFLNSQNVVALLNKPQRKGAELRVFHLYPTGPAIMVQQKSLPWHIKQAVSMDVCALDTDKDGNQQFVVAVAGQDVSIEVYTVDYRRKTETFSNFKSYLTLRDVHDHQMTKICFSPFHSPVSTITSEKSELDSNEKPKRTQRPDTQYIRLASVSMGNTVVVDTFPVSPLNSKDKNSRYVLSHPRSVSGETWSYIMLISLVLAAIAFLLQTIYVGSAKVLHQFREEHSITPVSSLSTSTLHTSHSTDVLEKERLHSLLSAHDVEHPSSIDTQAPQQTALVLRPVADSTGVTLDVHPDKEVLLQQDTDAKHWDELEEHQKAGWKEKLKQAGHWAEEEGETIFKGILFSEYAGMIGQAAAHVLREL